MHIKNSERSMLPTSRRGFIKLMSGSGAGLMLAINSPLSFANQSAEGLDSEGQLAPNAFIRIGTDSQVTVMMKHLEMGQGTHTGLSTMVAEELDADWSQILPVGAPADARKYNNRNWGPVQGTGGSSAMANSFEQMRLAGATAKAMLVAAAAKQWQVPASSIVVKQGVVHHAGTNRHASFGELVNIAATLPVPAADSITLKDPSDFRYIGQSLVRKDVGKTDGTAIFTQDFKREGMLTALVAHSPKFGGKVKRFDANKAKASPGVIDVVEIPSGIAVVAKDFWSAKVGRDQLQIEWDDSEAFTGSSEQLMKDYRELSTKTGNTANSVGNSEVAFSQAATVIEATYEFPYLSHSAMEPMNCVAQVGADSCEIWNGEQFQTIDQGNIARVLGLTSEKVKINMLFAGGSFGRRANAASDYLVETVNIAKQFPNIPVKLVWTREDDTRGGFYRPAYVHHVKGGLDADGNIIAWHQHIVGQSIASGTPFEPGMVTNGVDRTSVEGASNLPYAIPNLNVELTSTTNQIPVLWWRSVGHTHTAYSTETFIDELAIKAGKDPVALRMELLEEHPRWQGVLKLAADNANWGSPLPDGWGRGIAVHESFNSYVAEVAEVSTQRDGSFKVERVVCAVDCGIAINPDIIRAQMEGGIGFGLSPVLGSEITFKDGQVVESNFHNYHVIRNKDMPEVEVHIVPSTQPPTGVGEPGTPPIAAAVANAIAAATGERHYQLPMRPKKQSS